MGRSGLRQRDAQHFLGARLADRAGHRDDSGARARARRPPEPLQRAQRVLDGEGRLVRGKVAPARIGDHGGRGARLEGARDMVMAVVDLALDGEKQVAGLKRSRVDRNAVDARAHRRARRAQRPGQFGFGP